MKNKNKKIYIVCALVGLILIVIGFNVNDQKVSGLLSPGRGGLLTPNNVDFGSINDNLTLDANTTITNNGFAFTVQNSSVSASFEVVGTASGSTGLFTKLVSGTHTASASVYSLEVGPGTTATASLLFGGKGCIQMLNTAGTPVYIRVNGTTVTATTVKCHP